MWANIPDWLSHRSVLQTYESQSYYVYSLRCQLRKSSWQFDCVLRRKCGQLLPDTDSDGYGLLAMPHEQPTARNWSNIMSVQSQLLLPHHSYYSDGLLGLPCDE